MISDEIRGIMLQIIYHCVKFQIVAVMILSVWTVLLLAYRRRREARLTMWNEVHEQQMMDEFLSFLDEAPEKVLKLKFFGVYKNQSLRDILLKQIGAIIGEERSYFCERYTELGFLKKDINQCASLDWSIRLAAVLRLGQLHFDELSPLLSRMTRDPHPIVAATAVYALSSLNAEANRPDADRLHAIMLEGRRNLLLGVISNWEKIYGFKPVFEACKRAKTTRLRNAVYIAAVETKDPAAVPFLVDLLETAGHDPAFQLSDDVLMETLRTLLEIGDPSALGASKRFVTHPSDPIKMRAIEMVATYGNELDFEYVIYHTRGASPDVRRQVENLKFSKEAA